MRYILLSLIAFSLHAQEAVVIPHEGLKEFAHNGNTIKGLATAGLGAKQYEVWKSSIAAGSCTPRHKHETEEIFVFFKGEGKAIVGEEEILYQAPCTLILPADIEHQIFNTGEEPTDHLAIMGIDSKIFRADGDEMHLPWRR